MAINKVVINPARAEIKLDNAGVFVNCDVFKRVISTDTSDGSVQESETYVRQATLAQVKAFVAALT